MFGGTVAILSLFDLIPSPSPPSPLGWILIPIGGITFALAGTAMILYGLGLPRLALGAAAGAALAFTLYFHWIAFGPGERHFQASSSLAEPGIARQTTTHAISELEGRSIFGIFSLALDVAVVNIIKTRLHR